MIQLTKTQACELLGISPKTLGRRMASGRYTFTRTGEGQYAEVSFTHSDLGLPEPSASKLDEQRESITDSVTHPEPADNVSARPESEPLADCANRPATQEAIDLE